MKESGIYCILNKINGKCYIGSSSDNFSRRWSIHRHQLNKNTHANLHLQSSWNKYGAENFDFSVLEIVEPKSCLIREQFYIDNIRPEYNILKKAGSPLGYRHSEDSKNKRSISLLGHIHSQETKDKISQMAKERFALGSQFHPMFGKKHSNNTKLKIKQKRQFQDMSHLCKSIKQLNKQTGEVIKIWDSIKSASKTLNIGGGNISSACNKNSNLKSAGGFRWEFI